MDGGKLTTTDREILRQFAKNNMSVKSTAAAVFLHENTVRYHLSKIKRVTGLDPMGFYDLRTLIQELESKNA